MRAVGLFLMVLILSTPGFARSKDSITVNFATSVRVGSKNLGEGNYKVTWKGTGEEAQVNFVQGKTVVTVPAKLVQAENHWVPLANDGFEVETQQRDGATVLQEIRLPHLNLLFGHEATPCRQDQFPPVANFQEIWTDQVHLSLHRQVNP